mmetsp:Transcript_80122/g.159256  ORF Transcript_80122/g.159256 Transcript_80122/m.159256 type:complete len:307 (-) Transcript_80122:338-1258(-)
MSWSSSSPSRTWEGRSETCVSSPSELIQIRNARSSRLSPSSSTGRATRLLPAVNDEFSMRTSSAPPPCRPTPKCMPPATLAWSTPLVVKASTCLLASYSMRIRSPIEKPPLQSGCATARLLHSSPVRERPTLPAACPGALAQSPAGDAIPMKQPPLASSTRSSTQWAPVPFIRAGPKSAQPSLVRRTAWPDSLMIAEACASDEPKVPYCEGAVRPGRWLKMAAMKPMLSFSLPLVMSPAKTLNSLTPSSCAASMMSWAFANGSAVCATAAVSPCTAERLCFGATAVSKCAYTRESLSAGPKLVTSL